MIKNDNKIDEEYFYKILERSKQKYRPGDMLGVIAVIDILEAILFIVLLTGYSYSNTITELYSKIFMFLFGILLTIGVLSAAILGRKNSSYGYKYQKTTSIFYVISLISVFVAIYSWYFISCDDRNANKSMIIAGTLSIVIGTIYLLYLLYKFSKDIKNGLFMKCNESHEFMGFKGKVICLISGVFIAFAPISGSITRAMNRSALSNNIKLSFLLLLILCIQFFFIVFIPESLIVVYCKLRFEEFNKVKNPSENKII